MRKKRLIVTACVAVAFIPIAISFRLLNPPIEVHGSLSGPDVEQIQRLVRDYQRAPLFPLSMDAVRQRFFQPIQCIYASPNGTVYVDCRLRKHAYDGSLSSL